MPSDRTSRFLARQRARTLVTLGLPLISCGPTTSSSGGLAQQDAATPRPTAADTRPGPPASADPAFGGALRCAGDQLREIACTEQRGAPCPGSLAARAENYIRRIEDFASERPFSYDPVLSSDVSALEPARPKCCFVRCGELKVAASAPMPVAKSLDMGIRPRCITMPDAPSQFPAEGAPRCPAALALPQSPTLSPFQGTAPSVDDPQRRPDSWRAERCCYHELTSLVGVGRPYRVDGERRAAADVAVTSRAPGVPAEVVAHVHALARGEHASIFAFAALARELAGLGAPAALLSRVRRAGRDEAAHARLAYAELERLSGERVRPAALPVEARSRPLAELLRETLRDGCFEEGLGAALAAHLAERVEVPELARLYRRLARDEARHAALAWEIVAFALERDRSLVRVLVEEQPRLYAQLDALPGASDDALEPWGVPAASTVRALARRVLDEWLSPCVSGLRAAA